MSESVPFSIKDFKKGQKIVIKRKLMDSHIINIRRGFFTMHYANIEKKFRCSPILNRVSFRGNDSIDRTKFDAL